MTAIDLDLDVVRELDGRVWVDDEDEFAEHQVSLGYPAEVIAAARASCDRLVGLVGGGHPPYDADTKRAWFERLIGGRGASACHETPRGPRSRARLVTDSLLDHRSQ